MSAFRPVPPCRRAVLLSLAVWSLAATPGCHAQEPPGSGEGAIVTGGDPVLVELARALLPDLARRSGLEWRAPVRIQTRSRGQLVSYLVEKLDQELPPAEAEERVRAYALLGLVPPDLDLRGLLLDVYTEQVAGFYEPDSAALFVLDDQPQNAVQGLMVHELVHALQDQWADLDSITDPAVGNDRATAAQAAIEGHATLVMLEFMTEQMRGGPVDLSEIPDFGRQVRPALEAMRGQFPALAAAPKVIQESLLFPYLEGAGFVQALWTQGDRVAPFGRYLPASTEQVAEGDLTDPPVELEVVVGGAQSVRDDVLGQLEAGLLVEAVVGAPQPDLVADWGGDRWVLLRDGAGAWGLVWVSVWDSREARDRFLERLGPEPEGLGGRAVLEPLDVDGRPGALLRVGAGRSVTVDVRVVSRP